MNQPVSSVTDRSLGSEWEEKLIVAFFVLCKNARIVEANHPTFEQQCQWFLELVRRQLREADEVTVKAIGGHLFVNDMLVKFPAGGPAGAESVLSTWQALGIGGVKFTPAVDMQAIKRFAKYVARLSPKMADDSSPAIALGLEVGTSISFLSAEEVALQQPPAYTVQQELRATARRAFFRAVTLVQEVMARTAADRDINISKTKRVVHTLVDQISRDESSLIELTAIKDFDDYTYAHSINVCVYALTMGVRLGMDRKRLSRLGFAALFHDVGKVKLPKDLIRKPDAYDENDWRQMQQHPLLGAKTVLRNMKLDGHTARAARATFEHHINEDLTGYPRLIRRKGTTNLFSKIVAIADAFDAMTSGRLYLKKRIPPDKALKKMSNQMRIKFEPLLLRLFHDIVGIYPAGSLVVLSTDELALVLTNSGEQRKRPCVKIVGDRQGLKEKSEWVDLSQPDQSHREIVRMIDAERFGLNLRDFILSD